MSAQHVQNTSPEKYSAKRHNHNIHNSGAEIVRLLDYIVGRVSGQFTPKRSPLQNDIRYGTGAYAVFGCYFVFAQISQPVVDNGRLYSLRY